MPRPLPSTIRALPAFGRRLARTPSELGRQETLLQQLTLRVEALESLVERLHAQVSAADPAGTFDVVCAVRESVESLSTEVTEHLNRVAAAAEEQGLGSAGGRQPSPVSSDTTSASGSR